MCGKANPISCYSQGQGVCEGEPMALEQLNQGTCPKHIVHFKDFFEELCMYQVGNALSVGGVLHSIYPFLVQRDLLWSLYPFSLSREQIFVSVIHCLRDAGPYELSKTILLCCRCLYQQFCGN